ncbi:hypothetical protein KGO5_01682 [Sinorhizobium sp. KGO-5]|nr:hypothetical protein KGO5_01682 [Sinorhizobium sp. KGO-5]
MVYIALLPPRRRYWRCDFFKDGTERPVRAALLIIMVMFFAGLALDIASLAAVLTTFVLLDRGISSLLRGHQPERGAS